MANTSFHSLNKIETYELSFILTCFPRTSKLSDGVWFGYSIRLYTYNYMYFRSMTCISLHVTFLSPNDAEKISI